MFVSRRTVRGTKPGYGRAARSCIVDREHVLPRGILADPAGNLDNRRPNGVRAAVNTVTDRKNRCGRPVNQVRKPLPRCPRAATQGSLGGKRVRGTVHHVVWRRN